MTGLTILGTYALRGPNIWARFPVLEVWVDLGEFADVSSERIPGFNDRLKAMLPSMVEHRCSVGERGGFFQRLDRGTYLAHIFEHVVLELQSLVGTPVGYGKTRLTHKDGIYKVGIEYDNEALGRAACTLGREVCLAAVHDAPLDLPAGIEHLKSVLEASRPARFVENLMIAAKRHGVPAALVPSDDGPGKLVRLGWGVNQRRVLDGQTDRSSGVGASIAADRPLTRPFLKSGGVPVPDGGDPARTPDEAWSLAEWLGGSVMFRPKLASKTGQTGPFTGEAEVRHGFATAPWWPIVDAATPGDPYRLLVIGGKLTAALDEAENSVLDRVCPEVAERAADAAASLRLDVALVEVTSPDLSRPLEEVGGVVTGIVPTPDLSHFPDSAATAMVTALFPEPRSARIPLLAVTGTNGKTTTTRLIAHLVGQVHKTVGFTCTEGIYIGDRRIATGDCSGPKSARLVLQHPAVNAAVLETARGGILREGLGFDRCDVGVITNIDAGDHLGSSDIETVEQLADVKGTLVWGVAKWGTAVLNAADPLVVAMRQYCDGSVAFFARDPNNAVIREHRASGGRAAFVRDNAVVLAEGDSETVAIGLDRVPLTHGGRVPFQVENVLAATLAAWCGGIPLDAICIGLETFRNGVESAPGRFNLFRVDVVTVVIDYAHNVSALNRLLEMLTAFPSERRSVVYSAAGDRRDADMVDQGEILGRTFDRVFLYEDSYIRGREQWEISNLFKQGIARGGRTQVVETILGANDTIERAFATAVPGELLFVQPNTIDDGVSFWNQMKSRGGREITVTEAQAGGG